MRDMAIRQDHTIVADPCRPPVAGTAVHRNKFPNGRIIANLYRCVFAVELKVLRISRDNRTRKYLAILSDPRALHDRNIASNPGTGADLNISMNHREWVHLHVSSDPGIRVDGSEFVDHSVVN